MEFKTSILTFILLLFFIVGFQSNCSKENTKLSNVKVTPGIVFICQGESA